nr:hypothetical protein [uncultured Acetatifactor sp.]
MRDRTLELPRSDLKQHHSDQYPRELTDASLSDRKFSASVLGTERNDAELE